MRLIVIDSQGIGNVQLLVSPRQSGIIGKFLKSISGREICIRNEMLISYTQYKCTIHYAIYDETQPLLVISTDLLLLRPYLVPRQWRPTASRSPDT